MGNIIVSKEIVAAFEKMASVLEQRKPAIMNAYLKNVGTWTDDYAVLNDVDFDTWVALIYGNYEIQKTPHEIIRDRYEHVTVSYRNSSFADGMLFVLEVLGEEVEGVNYSPVDEMPGDSE